MLWLLLYFYSNIERFPEYDGYLCLVENIALTLCYGCNLFVQFLLRGNFNCCQPPETRKGTNQDKIYRCLSRKVLCLQILEKVVFSSPTIGLQLQKMKRYLINFMLIWEIIENFTQSTDSVQKFIDFWPLHSNII